MILNSSIVFTVHKMVVACDNVDDNGSECRRQTTVYIATGSGNGLTDALNHAGWSHYGSEDKCYCEAHS